jgi:hypothetical protein
LASPKKFIIDIDMDYTQLDRKEKIEEDIRKTKRCIAGMMMMEV